jgi:3-isopropylmalate/(R)-2-methylmalate dehydratase small subunit
MEPFPHLDAAILPIARSNVDTDQVIPARYLQKPRSDDFGQFLFRDLRFDKEGKENSDFVLNKLPYREARIVVAQENFGCGSSREHAVWALHDYGFRAVIAPSFGDIFFSNALKNGLLPVVLPASVIAGLLETARAQPGTRLLVDLPAQTVTASDGAVHRFDIDAFSKKCLVEGLDEIDYTLQKADQITAFEQRYSAAYP